MLRQLIHKKNGSNYLMLRHSRFTNTPSIGKM